MSLRWLRLSLLCIVVPIIFGCATVGSPAPDVATQYADSLGVKYKVQSNLTYATASNIELKLDLFLPRESAERVPLAVIFHGGGWEAGSKESVLNYVGPYLKMGFVVANVNYRLTRDALAPAAVEDTRCALRWLSRRAKQFKIDTNKIVLVGGSAGGHLALITGMLPLDNPFDRVCTADDRARWPNTADPSMAVTAIVNNFGIADVEDLLSGANAKQFAIDWLGATPNREAVARSVSPIQYVRAELPAIFTAHGDADPLVPYSHSTRLHAALNNAGVPNELATVPGGGHGDFSATETQRVAVAVLAFLFKQGIRPVSP
jgi:acetyl esterase/lipase